MNGRAKVVLTVLLLLCVGAISAWGEGEDSCFEFLDRNGDGLVSGEELAEAQNMAYVVLATDLDAADADEDGKLTGDEYHDYHANLEGAQVSEESGESEEAENEQMLTVLKALCESEEENAELESVIAELKDQNETDVVTYVLARPKVYPLAYKRLVHWANWHTGRSAWAKKVIAANKVRPVIVKPKVVKPKVVKPKVIKPKVIKPHKPPKPLRPPRPR